MFVDKLGLKVGGTERACVCVCVGVAEKVGHLGIEWLVCTQIGDTSRWYNRGVSSDTSACALLLPLDLVFRFSSGIALASL